MINLWNLNLICHMHCMGLIINLFYYYLLWFGIHLHLVTANKILTNLLKAMLSFNFYCWSALHFMNSHLWWVYATLFPTTCWAMNMCELTLAVSHTPHRRRTCGSRGATARSSIRARWHLPVDFLAPRMDFRSCYIYLLFCKTSAL